MTYGRYVGGNYYLLPETSEAKAAYPYLYKDSSDNWYIVKVEEAIKPAKITSDSTGTGSSAYYDNMSPSSRKNQRWRHNHKHREPIRRNTELRSG